LRGYKQVNANKKVISKFCAKVDNEHSYSSTILELLAIISVILVIPNDKKVTICTDSQAVILKMNTILQDYNEKSMRKELKDKDIYTWNWVKLFIKTNRLSIDFIKVKGHGDDEYNNICDKMAVDVKKRGKEGGVKNIINYTRKKDNGFSYFCYWKNIQIKGAIRQFIKDITFLS